MNIIIDPSLVLYLPLHELEGDSFMSRDGYGHLCTVTGALWRPDGRSFDGIDDFISLPDFSTDFTDEATIIAWVKLDDASPANPKLGLWEIHAATPNQATLYPYTDGKAYLSTFRTARVSGIVLSGAVNLENWHTVMITTKPGTNNWKFYQDLELVKQVDGEVSVNITGGSIQIGRDTSQASNFFLDGNLGELVIYNRFFTLVDYTTYRRATEWRYR